MRGEDGAAGYTPAIDCRRFGMSSPTATILGGGALSELSGASSIAAGIFPDKTCVWGRNGCRRKIISASTNRQSRPKNCYIYHKPRTATPTTRPTCCLNDDSSCARESSRPKPCGGACGSSSIISAAISPDITCFMNELSSSARESSRPILGTCGRSGAGGVSESCGAPVTLILL